MTKAKTPAKPKSKAAAKASVKPTGGAKPFNILAQGASIVEATREALGRTASDVLMVGKPGESKHIMPFSSFALQSIFKARGLVTGTLVDVLGADGLGKTSLAYYFMGQAMAANGACMYVEAEGKPLDPSRAARCLHPNRAIAEQMYGAIYQTSAREIREAVNKIETWILKMRAPGSKIPSSSPLFVVLDTFSKLMAPTEAAGFSAYASKKDNEKAKLKERAAEKKAKAKGKDVAPKETGPKPDESKELGAGSNQGHAKAAHEWSRRMTYYMSRYNVIVLLLRHQNDKDVMGGGPAGGGVVLSTEQKDAFNRTSNGGRAFHQSAAYQMILSRQDWIKASIDGEQVKLGMNVKLSLSKNNWGPLADGRYRLTMVPRHDTEEWMEPAINFDIWLPNILKQKSLMKVRPKTDTTVVTSDFNTAGRAEEMELSRFCDLFYSDPARVEALGRQLEFAHYDDKAIMPKLMPVSMHRPTEVKAAIVPNDPQEAAEQDAAINADPNVDDGAPTGTVIDARETAPEDSETPAENDNPDEPKPE